MFFLFSAPPKNWLIIACRKSNVYLHYTLTKIKSQIIKKTEEPGKALKNCKLSHSQVIWQPPVGV